MPLSEPVVHYHIQRGDLFFCYDRHGEPNPFWASFDDPFLCCWEDIEVARRYIEPGDFIRVPVDGHLV